VSSAFPEIVDVWRMVTARRLFHGTLPLTAMPRLLASAAGPTGTVSYDLEFGRDELGVAFLRVCADIPLTLICQRTLEEFVLPMHIDSRLGLITSDDEERGLPESYDPLLVTQDGMRLREVIEDELILALPLIPMKPGTEDLPETVWSDEAGDVVEEPRKNPFAALGVLKKTPR
jgi:uncharacterized protein